MANLFKRSGSGKWWGKWRGPDGKTWRKSLNRDIAGFSEARAQKLLDELERSAAILRNAQAHNLEEIRLAATNYYKMQYISAEEFASWLTVSPLNPTPVKRTLITIEEAALAHSTAQHERDHNDADFRRHLRELRDFLAWSGLVYLKDLRLNAVETYIRKLKNEGRGYDGRRHCIQYLRQAARMSPQYGIQDVLAGHRINKREIERKEVQVFSSDELFRILNCCLEKAQDFAPLVIVQGFMGLRPSEAMALKNGDINGGILSTGSKNQPSIRDLPIPPSLIKYLEAGEAADPQSYLVTTRNKVPVNRHVLAKRFARVTGHSRPSSLRKSFATISTFDLQIPETLLEPYLGHQLSRALPITSQHYLSAKSIERLRAVSDAWEAHIRAQCPHI